VIRPDAIPVGQPVRTPAPAKDSFRFVRANELLVNAVHWLIHGYLECDTVAVMYGQPATGKSFLALDLSCCIAAGLPFHGHPVTQGAVFYIVGEGHGGVARRVNAWAQHSQTEVPRSLFISETAADFFDSRSTESVADAVESIASATGSHPALIVVDTMARNFRGEENSATDVSWLVHNLDELRRRWRAAVLIVHHTGKDSDRGARGSTALKGAADAEYEVTRSDRDSVVRLISKKMKDAVQPAALAFKLEPVFVSDTRGALTQAAALSRVSYNPASEAAQPQGKNQQRALQILRDMHAEAKDSAESVSGLSYEAWKKRLADDGAGRNRAKEACEGLVKRGVVSVEDDNVTLALE
jgi:KaiC/GvpD/RAD55 family RecA-like ATPase